MVTWRKSTMDRPKKSRHRSESTTDEEKYLIKRIMFILKDYDKVRSHPPEHGGYGDPDISKKVVDFLRPGLVHCQRVSGGFYDPMLYGYGSDTIYDCENSKGEKMRLSVWGNIDGYGIMEEK